MGDRKKNVYSFNKMYTQIIPVSLSLFRFALPLLGLNRYLPRNPRQLSKKAEYVFRYLQTWSPKSLNMNHIISSLKDNVELKSKSSESLLIELS